MVSHPEFLDHGLLVLLLDPGSEKISAYRSHLNPLRSSIAA